MILSLSERMRNVMTTTGKERGRGLCGKGEGVDGGEEIKV